MQDAYIQMDIDTTGDTVANYRPGAVTHWYSQNTANSWVLGQSALVSKSKTWVDMTVFFIIYNNMFINL